MKRRLEPLVLLALCALTLTPLFFIGTRASASASSQVVAAIPGASALLSKSGLVSSAGDNTIVTPTNGKRLRLHYLSYNPDGAVEVGFQMGGSGVLILRNKLTVGGSIIAKDFGDYRYLQGAINDPLTLTLSAAVSTIWNVFYVEF
jgi:hypothetical protein